MKVLFNLDRISAAAGWPMAAEICSFEGSLLTTSTGAFSFMILVDFLV